MDPTLPGLDDTAEVQLAEQKAADYAEEIVAAHAARDRAEAEVERLREDNSLMHRSFFEATETLEAERDAAKAIVARVQEALAEHPRCERYDGDDPITCGWKRAVLDVQDAIEGR